MSNQQYYSGLEIAKLAGCTYARVLGAIHSNELPSLRIGGSYAVQVDIAQEWIDRAKLLADPNLVEKLEAEIKSLKAENAKLRAA